MVRKNKLDWCGRVVRACVVFTVAWHFTIGSLAHADELERGRYLVEALAACDNCHTPRGPDGYNEKARFSGGSQSFAGPSYTVRGGNITTDRETGVGGWSDGELRAALVDGLGRAGRLSPFMPSESYRVLTDRDAAAIIAFIRSIPPVSTRTVARQKFADEPPRLPIPGAQAALSEAALTERTTRGLYVASIARCMACHSGESNDIPDHEHRLGAGGKIFGTPAGVAVASNITAHLEKGVGGWSDDELKRAITQGVGRDGHSLKPTMANLSKAHFSKMSADDLDALVAWVRSIQPRE